MKFFKDIFKKVKPIYIILALFVVVIVISALGSRTTKEGMAGAGAGTGTGTGTGAGNTIPGLSSYEQAELDQLVADKADIFEKIVTFVSSHKEWEGNSTFLTNVKNALDLFSASTYQEYVQSLDANGDGIIVVDASNKFIRDNESTDSAGTDHSGTGNTLLSGQKIFHYNPLENQLDLQVSLEQVETLSTNAMKQINSLKNDNDKALLINLCRDIGDKTERIGSIINRNAPIKSFLYYKAPYSITLEITQDGISWSVGNTTGFYGSGVVSSSTNGSAGVGAGAGASSARERERERARARARARAKAELELAELKKLAEKASQVPPAPYVQWEASSCGDDTTLASAASIACINSLWKGYGCTPNLVNTSNPNYLLDSNTNQLYDIANQTLGQMKVLMAKTSHNPTYCYGSVSPGAASSGVNATSADYWKNLYLSAVSVPNANANVPNASNTDSCTAGSQSYNSLFIPSDAPLAGTGVGTGGAGTGTGTGTGTDNSGNSTSSNSSNSTVSGGSSDGEPLSDQDMYLLSNQSPSDCPVGASGTAGSCGNNIKSSPVPPCPPCERCPEPSFDCKKVPTYNSAANNQYLPQPVLADFSQFGM